MARRPPRKPRERPRQGFRPSKERGQNFLVDPNLARKFVELLAPGPGERVLEIGPGKGALTAPLRATGCRVLAVELDLHLAGELRERFEDDEGVEVVQGDFLELSVEALGLARGERLSVLSNVPYSVSGAVLGRLLTDEFPVERAVLGLQKEVAERLAAPPGSRTYGALSVLAAAFGRVEPGFRVPPHCFRPRPKVESRTVRLVRSADAAPVRRGSALDRLLRAAFATRRKTLANGLSANLGCAKAEVTARLEEAGIDPRRRAETLALAEFRLLAGVLFPE